MATYPRRIGTLLAGRFTSVLSEQERLIRAVQERLPTPLRAHCRHCIRKGDTLVIQVGSSSHASIIRFHAPTLLRSMNDDLGLQLRDIQIRNLIPKGEPTANRRTHSPVEGSARHILEAASACESGDIRTSLLRLGSTLSRLGRKQSILP